MHRPHLLSAPHAPAASVLQAGRVLPACHLLTHEQGQGSAHVSWRLSRMEGQADFRRGRPVCRVSEAGAMLGAVAPSPWLMPSSSTSSRAGTLTTNMTEETGDLYKVMSQFYVILYIRERVIS